MGAMGGIFDIGCECSKKPEISDRGSSIKRIRVTDSTSSEIIYSTIMPKELYHDNSTIIPKNINGNNIKNTELNVFEKYIQIYVLGQSYYSKVYKVQNKLNNQIRAMKEIPKENIENANETGYIVSSINILRNLDHPNISRLYEFYEDEKNFYLIYDLCENITINEIILKENIFMCEFLLKFIMYKLLMAVDYLHRLKIIHGNIKISNIGLIKKPTKDTTKKDLNIIEIIKEICTNNNLRHELETENNIEALSEQTKIFINKLLRYDIKLLDCWSQGLFIRKATTVEKIDLILDTYYLSPELFDANVTKERDEWACGIIMFYLIKLDYPFDGNTRREIVYEIHNRDIDDEINDLKASKECKDLLFKLLNKNPHYRIKAEEALKHSFFKKGIDISAIINKNFI